MRRARARAGTTVPQISSTARQKASEWAKADVPEKRSARSILHAALDETFLCACLDTGNRLIFAPSPKTKTSLKV
jgi:hypothetical protein